MFFNDISTHYIQLSYDSAVRQSILFLLYLLVLNFTRFQVRLQEKMSENKKLSAPLKQMQDDVLRLRSELAEYEAEKAEMRRVKAALLVVGNTNIVMKLSSSFFQSNIKFVCFQ